MGEKKMGHHNNNIPIQHQHHRHHHHHQQQQQQLRPVGVAQQVRHYTPMTSAEEDAEKKRVAGLSDFKKEQELRQLNREIMRLKHLRGINTGEVRVLEALAYLHFSFCFSGARNFRYHILYVCILRKTDPLFFFLLLTPSSFTPSVENIRCL